MQPSIHAFKNSTQSTHSVEFDVSRGAQSIKFAAGILILVKLNTVKIFVN
jgi:hypothetical protein